MSRGFSGSPTRLVMSIPEAFATSLNVIAGQSGRTHGGPGTKVFFGFAASSLLEDGGFASGAALCGDGIASNGASSDAPRMTSAANNEVPRKSLGQREGWATGLVPRPRAGARGRGRGGMIFPHRASQRVVSGPGARRPTPGAGGNEGADGNFAASDVDR